MDELKNKKNYRVMVDMSLTLLHHGHVRLLKNAKRYGYVVVALTTDEEIKNKKGPVFRSFFKLNVSYEKFKINFSSTIVFMYKCRNVKHV